MRSAEGGGSPNRLRPGLLAFIIPLVIYVSGSALHFERGYYNRELFAPHGLGSDDAYIGYRYGWNLAHFGHLSWNESLYRRTEGFTNPLWVFISAAWSLWNLKDWLYPLTAATSVFMCALLLGLLISYVRAEGGRAVWVIGPALAAASPVVWLHSTSGLESGVFGISLAALAYAAISGKAAERGKAVLCLLAALPCLLRSDGFVYVGAVVLAAAVAGFPSWKPAAAGLVSSSAALFGVRFFVFGTLLPNTAVAKLNFGLSDRLPVGLTILGDVLLHSGLGAFLALGLIGLATGGGRRFPAGAAIVFAWLAYFVYIGGDHFLERHLIGALVLSAALTGPIWSRGKVAYRGIILTGACLCVLLPIFSGDERFPYTKKKYSDPWVLLGKAMASERLRFGVFVTEPAGKIPFFAGGDCIDSFGLNDPDLAKVKGGRFWPGHSAGSKQDALRIARTHPCGTVSFFSYFVRAEISAPERIALWMNNRHPQDSVQTLARPEDWEAAQKAKDPFLWSVLSQPVQVKASIDPAGGVAHRPRAPVGSSPYSWLDHYADSDSIGKRIPAPTGYERIEAAPDSFESWLRGLPLRGEGSLVYLYDGKKKANQEAHFAVLSIDTGTKDLQQCADAVVRLNAEYLYSIGNYTAIHYNSTGGQRIDFSRWIQGERPAAHGDRIVWHRTGEPGSSYACFRKYLDTVFSYAGTYSLSQELETVTEIRDMRIGDVFIRGGFPGHAVIVVDMAVQPTTGKKLFLLAQSFMPAQDIHILKNPNAGEISPWYESDFGRYLVTPEWTFRAEDLKRFSEDRMRMEPGGK